jgi:hypothetical protein
MSDPTDPTTTTATKMVDRPSKAHTLPQKGLTPPSLKKKEKKKEFQSKIN